MIWLITTILTAAVIVLVVIAYIFGPVSLVRPLFGALDTLHSELKAEKLAREARRELAARRSSETNIQ